jgi:Mrp family chromosome partitioning ATPase
MSAESLHFSEQTPERLQRGGAFESPALHLLDAPMPIVVGQMRLALNAEHCQCAREVAPIVARLLTGAESGAAVVHVTAAEPGDGASVVARHIAHTAACLPWCKTLLLDANSVMEDGEAPTDWALPNLLEGYTTRGTLEVTAIESAKGRFHAAAMPPASCPDASAKLKKLRQILTGAYTLVVVDCPPLLDAPYLLPISPRAPQIVLALRSRRTRISVALRIEQEIRGLGAELFGAVLTNNKPLIPRLLDRFL